MLAVAAALIEGDDAEDIALGQAGRFQAAITSGRQL